MHVAPILVGLLVTAGLPASGSFFIHTKGNRSIQNIEILTDRALRCTLKRDGATLATVDVPQPGMSDNIEIDVTDTQSDIMLLCSSGDRAIARTLQWCGGTMFWYGPSGGSSTTEWGYPTVARAFFDRRQPVIPCN
jgi:hypothetical protein